MRFRTIVLCTLVLLFGLAQALGHAGALGYQSTAYAHAITGALDSGTLVNTNKDTKSKNDNKSKDDNSNKNDNGADCSGRSQGDGAGLAWSASILAGPSTPNDLGSLLKEKKTTKDDNSNKNDNRSKDDNRNANDNTDEAADCPGNGDETTASVTIPATMPASVLPLTEVTGTSTGGDSTVALVDERVVLRIFPWTPSGITFKLRFVDPETVSAPPGKRVGKIVFRLEAQDASGKALDVLPAEVNLSARYADQDVTGASEQNVTLSRLNSADNQWKAAPKLTRSAETNYIAASIMEPGTYAIHIP